MALYGGLSALPRAARPSALRGTSRRSLSVLAAKTALITGGNTGIGYISALSLCKQGYAVTIACRDDVKATAAAQRIREAAPGAQIDTLHLDLADLSSVRDAASTWLESGKPINVLLNNAGVMACPEMKTKDGFEYQLGVNHLGHFLWTTLLLPQVQAENNGPARIINVSSTAHLPGKMYFDNIMLTGNYDPWRSYCQSKLANVLFTYELARRLGAADITANCLHPGVVRTELARYLIPDPNSLTAKFLGLAMYPFTKSPEQGAETSIYLASSPEVEGVSGKYYDNCKPVTSSVASYDVDAQRRLWQLSEELTAAKTQAAVVA